MDSIHWLIAEYAAYAVAVTVGLTLALIGWVKLTARWASRRDQPPTA